MDGTDTPEFNLGHYLYNDFFFLSSDIYIVADDSDEQLALKLHRYFIF